MSLKPVLIFEYSDTFQLLVVQVKEGRMNKRVITGYGTQESRELDVKMQFFRCPEEEVAKAEIENKSVICMGDMNSQLGQEFIPNDPKQISENGKILAGILERNALTVVNGLQGKCEGLITRERNTVNGVEKSIIDFVIVSQDLVKYVGKMNIDDKRKYVLTRLTKTTNGIIKKESDHNIMITELRIKCKADRKSSKMEIYNLKSKECPKFFKQDTEDTSELSNIIDKDEEIDNITKKFVHRLNGFIKKHFKKVRVI